MRRDDEYVEGGGMMMYLDGRRRTGGPKRRWMDRVNVDLRDKGLLGEETQNRAVSRQLVTYIDPTWKWEHMWWKKKKEDYS